MFEMFHFVDILLDKTSKEWLNKQYNHMILFIIITTFYKRLNSDTIPWADLANIVIVKEIWSVILH